MEHSYRYRLRFGGPIWLPKLPSIFPRVFENFQATDRSISHARRYRFPKIATGNRTILVSLSMFYAGHRWYMCAHRATFWAISNLYSCGTPVILSPRVLGRQPGSLWVHICFLYTLVHLKGG